jgi:TPR repeat protein
MHKKNNIFLFLLIIFLFNAQITQASLEEGISASQRGDYITAFREFRSMANRGHMKAQFHLGLLYEMGLGVPKDYTEAAKWYRKAAVQGDIGSMKKLEEMRRKGLTTSSKQPAIPPQWGGSTYAPESQHEIGIMYFKGIGVQKNYSTAADWFRKSANQGYYKAQHDLALMLNEGRGISQNDTEAYKLFHSAANQGYGPSQYQLGKMFSHEKSKGIPQRFILAYMWFEIAAANGVEKAKEKQNELSETMTEEQVREAETEAHMWLIKNRPAKQ